MTAYQRLLPVSFGLASSRPLASALNKNTFWYSTDSTDLSYSNGTAWTTIVSGSGGAPTGAAGGDLTGNYPNPTVGANKITAAKIFNGTITDAQVSSANKDGTAGVASLRTLGSGAQQAVSGTDIRLSAPHSGTLSITAGQTTATATHTLGGTPTWAIVLPTSDTLEKRWWYAQSSTNITVNIDSVAAVAITFSWVAVKTA